MHSLHFSKGFLKWILSYLSNRTQFLSELTIEHQQVLSDFGIPQGSILGPMIVNLYVADLEDNINHRAFCFQYADDTTIYKHCKFSAIKYCEARMNTTLKQLTEWSNVSNLALNPAKTKCMVFSTQQLSKTHSISSYKTNLVVNGKSLERTRTTKLLGLRIN